MASAPGQLRGILNQIHAPVSAHNIQLLQGWQRAEGGSASYNPFNTTQTAPGAGSYNSVGVRSYRTPQQGTQATVRTLLNGRYQNILSDLRTQAPGQKFASDVGSSPWGTSGSLLSRVLGAGVPPPSAGAVATPGSPSPRAGVAPAPAAPVPRVVDNSFLQGIINLNADIAGVPTITLPKVTAIGQLSAPSPTHPNGVQIAVDHNQPLSPLASGVIQAARKFLGTPYVWGGAKPGGFDCSGLIQYVYGLKGIALPRTSQQQFKVGRPVAMNALKPGDILFFSGSDGTKQAPGHEALYIGHGQFIQAPHTGDVVKISNLSDAYYRSTFAGARRVS